MSFGGGNRAPEVLGWCAAERDLSGGIASAAERSHSCGIAHIKKSAAEKGPVVGAPRTQILGSGERPFGWHRDVRNDGKLLSAERGPPGGTAKRREALRVAPRKP